MLETNVLRLEARLQVPPQHSVFALRLRCYLWTTVLINALQDLARGRQGDVVAVHCVNEPEYLNEGSLDAFVRVLCTRELAMNAIILDIRIPRAFPGGGSFCLQEFVPFSDHRLLVVRFQHGAPTVSTSSSDSRDEDDGAVVDDSITCRTESASEPHRGCYSFSTCRAPRLFELEGSAVEQPASYDAVAEKMRVRLRGIVQLVLLHFHVFFGLQILDVTLEFAHDKSCGSIHLVGAQSVKVLSASQPTLADSNPKREKLRRRTQQATIGTRSNQSESTKARRLHATGASALGAEDDDLRIRQQVLSSHTTYRVCRQCRKSQDVDLAKELALNQVTMRRVLANLQSAQEERAAALQRDLESQETLQHHRQSIAHLELELERARSSLEAKDGCIQELTRENAALKSRVADAVEEAHVARSQAQLAEERVVQADLLKQSAVVHQDDTLQQGQLDRLETQNAQLEVTLTQLQKELERNQQTLGKLQAKYEDVRADRDELHFQWRFVWRKLVDIKEPSVAPPQRIGGGYHLYPGPSDANVRDVIKWLVDFDAKRATIEAHKKKAIGRRSKLELELMQTLGSPKKRKDTGVRAAGPDSAGQGSCSPPHRSRSPSRRSPPRRPKKADSELAAIPIAGGCNALTLLAEAVHRNASGS